MPLRTARSRHPARRSLTWFAERVALTTRGRIHRSLGHNRPMTSADAWVCRVCWKLNRPRDENCWKCKTVRGVDEEQAEERRKAIAAQAAQPGPIRPFGGGGHRLGRGLRALRSGPRQPERHPVGERDRLRGCRRRGGGRPGAAGDESQYPGARASSSQGNHARALKLCRSSAPGIAARVTNGQGGVSSAPFRARICPAEQILDAKQALGRR
jgi:hypothetical protein